MLATRRVSTIEKEFAQAAAEGWEFWGLVSRFDFRDMMMMAFTHAGSESFMALEREAGIVWGDMLEAEYQLFATPVPADSENLEKIVRALPDLVEELKKVIHRWRLGK